MSPNEENKKAMPTFMDRFALHLAKELVGPKTVLQVLNEQLSVDKSKSKRSLLYWRSELFLKEASDMMDASKWPCKDGSHLMYLDAKFEFCSKPKKDLKTTWGCFVLHSNNADEDVQYKNYGRYYQSQPMTLNCLEKHVESMDIDLHELPQKMAKFMRPALMASSKSKEVYPIQLKSNEKKIIKLELDYKELGEKGVLTLDLRDEASSPYNELGLEPFYLRELLDQKESKDASPSNNNGSNQVVGSSTFGSPTTPKSPGVEPPIEDSQLDQLLQEWFRHLEPKPDDTKPVKVSSSSPAAIATTTNPSKKRPAKNPQNHGMTKIKKKKKKKGGLFG